MFRRKRENPTQPHPYKTDWEILYDAIVTKPSAGYSSGTYKDANVWDISGFIGDTWHGAVRYGVRECSKGWEWEVGIELDFKPKSRWGPLNPTKYWPLSGGVVAKSFKKENVATYVAQEAGNWLDVLKLWARLRFDMMGEQFDSTTRVHGDCEWCMGHRDFDGTHRPEPFNMNMSVAVGEPNDN